MYRPLSTTLTPYPLPQLCSGFFLVKCMQYLPLVVFGAVKGSAASSQYIRNEFSWKGALDYQ